MTKALRLESETKSFSTSVGLSVLIYGRKRLNRVVLKVSSSSRSLIQCAYLKRLLWQNVFINIKV